ncbi:MAG: hypothetical protein U0556_00505 [Dehalococcoidia bacterium]
MTAGEEIAKRLKNDPHWRVVIHPTTFDAERIPSLGDCRNIVAESQVTLRGWGYPHLDESHRETGSDWVAGWSEVEGRVEYWRFFQSGQFVHLLSFHEDGYLQRNPSRYACALGDAPSGFEPNGFLEVSRVLLQTTEIFQFADRLARNLPSADLFTVSIELTNVLNRVLTESDITRHWYGFHPATASRYSRERTWNRIDLLTRSAEFGLDAATWIYDCFGWSDPPRRALADLQQRFLDRRFSA